MFVLLLVTVVYKGAEHFGINPFEGKINIDFDVAFKLNESEIEEKFKQLKFNCSNENSNLGDRVCWANISRFNGVPADIIAFFFQSGKHRFIRVAADGKDHNELKSYINDNFEYVGVSPHSKEEVGQSLGVWSSNSGRLILPIDSPPLGKQSILLWERM